MYPGWTGEENSILPFCKHFENRLPLAGELVIYGLSQMTKYLPLTQIASLETPPLV